ncbi:MAG: O-antigen ligase family protein [Phycisphaerae bacterium]
MADAVGLELRTDPSQRHRQTLSRITLCAGLILLAATFFLISPPIGQNYPGAIPWSDHSILRAIVDLMSLGGLTPTIRGVEIKDFAFYLAAGGGLTLMALRAAVSAAWPEVRERRRGAWFVAQGLLGGWVALSLASATWSTDAEISVAQSAIYALSVGWAVSLAWTLQGRSIPVLIGGYVGIAALGSSMCIWYFYERNPFHRPGFPIGNPGPLAACILPAIIICVAVVTGRFASSAAAYGRRWRTVGGAVLVLAPLLWCFWLTGSRGGFVGLAIGLGTVGFLRAGPRVRWALLVTAVVVAGSAATYAYVSRLDPTLARGATVRFRFYAWRYASELWEQRPISGVGAGAYPRLASQLAVNDRALDPAAFMGDIVEHAHNELFEVLTEIGLVGGVTFVGAYLATIVAALVLLRSNLSEQRRWLLIGLTAAMTALLCDGLFGPAMRLPGLPAVHYTLLGTLWAACRYAVRNETADAAMTDARVLGRRRARRIVVALGALAAAGLAFFLAVQNWRAAMTEHDAAAARSAGNLELAERLASAAEHDLLDPVRKLDANRIAVIALYEQAEAAFEAWEASRTQSGATTQSASAAPPGDVVALCTGAHVAATDLQRRASTLGRMLVYAARAAEMCATLAAVTNTADAEQWQMRAWQCWRVARDQRPFDAEALLALARFPGTMGDHIALLRNALRGGMPNDAWRARLAILSRQPEFAAILDGFRASIEPIGPDSDMNSIIAMMAPETQRLIAAWRAQQGDFRGAADRAARAAALYVPLRSRFPLLGGVALAEQAEYEIQADPGVGKRCAALLEEAIDSLPRIQEQQYNEQIAPFRRLRAYYFVAAGQEGDAERVLAELDQPPAQRATTIAGTYVDLAQRLARRDPAAPELDRWLDAAIRRQPAHARAWAWRAWLALKRGGAAAAAEVVRAARVAGVPQREVEQIITSLEKEFPDQRQPLREHLKKGENPPR